LIFDVTSIVILELAIEGEFILSSGLERRSIVYEPAFTSLIFYSIGSDWLPPLIQGM
jgi:hypothetical protein